VKMVCLTAVIGIPGLVELGDQRGIDTFGLRHFKQKNAVQLGVGLKVGAQG